MCCCTVVQLYELAVSRITFESSVTGLCRTSIIVEHSLAGKPCCSAIFSKQVVDYDRYFAIQYLRDAAL
jgi:hypothetical protein